MYFVGKGKTSAKLQHQEKTSLWICKKYHLSLKSMIQSEVLMTVNQMTCLKTQAENFLHDIIYNVLNILIQPERK